MVCEHFSSILDSASSALLRPPSLRLPDSGTCTQPHSYKNNDAPRTYLLSALRRMLGNNNRCRSLGISRRRVLPHGLGAVVACEARARFSYAHMPSLANKTAVVTGASSGLGLAVARGLADAGCTVITTARTFDKCAKTTKMIGSGTCVAMELLELKSVYRAARVVKEMAPSGIDFLVLNAGIMMPPLSISEDGLEAQFQTNHLGHFVLTNELLPLLTEGARVVAVSSVAHRFSSPTSFSDGREARPSDI